MTVQGGKFLHSHAVVPRQFLLCGFHILNSKSLPTCVQLGAEAKLVPRLAMTVHHGMSYIKSRDHSSIKVASCVESTFKPPT